MLVPKYSSGLSYLKYVGINEQEPNDPVGEIVFKKYLKSIKKVLPKKISKKSA